MARSPSATATHQNDRARTANWVLRQASPGETFTPPAPGTMMEHDPEWLLAIRHPGHGSVLLAERDSRQLPIYVHDGALSFVLGGMALRRIEIRRHVLTGNLPDWSQNDLVAILGELRGLLDHRSVVFLIGVVEGEPLWQALQSADLRRRYHVLQSGETDTRRLVDLPETFDEYLGSLPRKARQDIRRSERRFNDAFGQGARLDVFSGPEEITAFLDSVEPVSARTYQSRLLGLGVKRGHWIERMLQAAAERGYARCYGLFVDQKLVAWRVGFVFQGTYFSHHIGYDPDWSEWHPGIVLQARTLRDLCSLSPTVQRIDMLHGDNAAKRKLANQSRREGKFYLFPRNLRGTLLYTSLGSFNRFSDALSALAARLKFKDRIRRVLRRV
ncbi:MULTISPECIES: GNAT family N-acetyltransferase [unclassified Thioalkalivibrio]|uniref:GNAT family N-acetyltransferase n=1 Tax=unclassified Thioalkalivibrio TaxID=2621013 RepID=UPI00036C3CF2|nr:MULTISPECIES: GNAT family N-acetyltransferase [unclassified Thioalkalivibrio]